MNKNKGIKEDPKVWNETQDKILKRWAEQAASYRVLHNRSYRKYKWLTGIFTIPVIILSTLITNYLVVGTLNIYFVLMYLALYKYTTSPEILYASLFLTALGIYKHRHNLLRIKNRTEPTFRSSL